MTNDTAYARQPVWALLVAVAIGGAFYIAGKNIEADTRAEQPGTVTVSGDGRAFITPDIARLNLGVQTGRQASAAVAMERLKTAMDAVIAAIEEEGIAERDIRTQSFWLNPVYDWTNGRQIPRGFEASQSLEVKVRDLDKVSDVLGAATAAGANQSGGVTFTVDDPEAKRAEARAEAIEEAKSKARELADQLDVDLGDIISFHEGYNSGVPPPIMYERASYGAGAASDEAAQSAVPLPAGEQEISVTVNITYEID